MLEDTLVPVLSELFGLECRHRVNARVVGTKIVPRWAISCFRSTDKNDAVLWQRVGGVVGYRICLTHRRSSVRTWADSFFQCFSMGKVDCFHPSFLSPGTVLSELGPEEWCNND